MKKFLLFMMVVFSTLHICEAQDTIFTFRKYYIIAKNIDTGYNIMYQKFNDTADNWYNVWGVNINRIHYHSGAMVIMNTYDHTKFNHYEPPVDSALLKAQQTKDSILTLQYSLRKIFGINTDLAQYVLSQPNIGFELKLVGPLFIGINGALIIPSPLFGVNPFANGQFTNPGLVYGGYSLRIYLKLYSTERPNWFWCLQEVYKSLSFNNVSFEDDYGDNLAASYNMSEKATTWGVDLFRGYEIVGTKNAFVLDFLCGFGVHIRNRNYTISDVYVGYEAGGPIAKDGNYSNILIVPTPEVGLRVGFNYLKKKK